MIKSSTGIVLVVRTRQKYTNMSLKIQLFLILWINLLVHECLFSTPKWSKPVLLRKLVKEARKTNTFHGFLLLPAAKEWLPLAIEKGCDFYRRRPHSTYILEFHSECQQHAIFSKSCLCFVFASASCLAVCVPLTLSLAISLSSSYSFFPLTLLRPRLRGLCFLGIGSSDLAMNLLFHPDILPFAFSPLILVFCFSHATCNPLSYVSSNLGHLVFFLFTLHTKLHCLVLFQI